MNTVKAAAYHGIENTKFALKKDGAYTAPFDIKYARGLSLNKALTATSKYADNRKVLDIPSDKGYDGELTTTAQDVGLELELGYMLEGEDGLMDLKVTSFPRGALYYEVTLEYEEEPSETIKVWLLGAELRKGNLQYNTDEENLNLGDYTYPLVVFGDPLMKAGGADEYRDSRGNTKRCFMIYKYSDDPDYEAFENQVPDAWVKA